MYIKWNCIHSFFIIFELYIAKYSSSLQVFYILYKEYIKTKVEKYCFSEPKKDEDPFFAVIKITIIHEAYVGTYRKKYHKMNRFIFIAVLNSCCIELS